MDVEGRRRAQLNAVADGMPLLADLHRCDVLLYETQSRTRVRLIAQARPHSVPPIHPPLPLRREQELQELPGIASILQGSESAQGPRQLIGHRSPIVQRAFAVHDEEGQVIGVLALEKSLVEHERHQARRSAFRIAVEDLRDMVLRGETAGLASLSPFLDTDGILLLNERGIILYASGLATYHYRRLGYSEELIGQSVAQLTPADSELARRVLDARQPAEEEERQGERIWRRKAIPLVGPQRRLPRPLGQLRPFGVGPRTRHTLLMTLHDATAAHRKAEEQVVRQAMVQEIHHRVKNNLQTVASLLRLQARRAEHDETRVALGEAINRILSIAVVHEFLSQHEKRINMRDVAGRIAMQVREGVIGATQGVTIRVEGDPIFLHPHPTTMGALVINELILNALEHGVAQGGGEVTVSFRDEGDRVCFSVRDSGQGLPTDFSLAQGSSLGLRIVQTIVENDLRGTFTLANVEGGVAATVSFPKGSAEQFG